MQFRSALCDHQDWRHATQQCIEQLGSVHDFTLGFIFVSDHFHAHFDDIIRTLKTSTGIAHWVGSEGIGIIGPGQEVYERGAISLLVTDLSTQRFCLTPTITQEPKMFLDHNRAWLDAHNPFFGIVHGDAQNPQIPEIITQFSDALSGGFFVGGLTSNTEGSGYQCVDTITQGGLSGVLFSNDVTVVSGLSQGCSPISPTYEITHCEQNIIFTLDHKPALEVMLAAVGAPMGANLNDVATDLFFGLPIANSDKHDYLVRNLVGIDEKNKLLAIGDHITPAQRLMFCKRDENTAIADMQRMLNDVAQRTEGKAKGALYYSCLGRGRYQFGTNNEELKLVQAVFGDLPLAGFYANGEISHNRLYGYTGVLLIFC